MGKLDNEDVSCRKCKKKDYMFDNYSKQIRKPIECGKMCEGTRNLTPPEPCIRNFRINQTMA